MSQSQDQGWDEFADAFEGVAPPLVLYGGKSLKEFIQAPAAGAASAEARVLRGVIQKFAVFYTNVMEKQVTESGVRHAGIVGSVEVAYDSIVELLDQGFLRIRFEHGSRECFVEKWNGHEYGPIGGGFSVELEPENDDG